MCASRLALLGCLFAAGCSPAFDEGRALEIVVNTDSALGDDAIKRIAALQLEVSGAESASLRFSVDAAPAWRTRRLVYRPEIARGELSLRVVGHSSGHVPIAEGTALASLDGRARIEVTLMLSASPPLEDAGVDLGAADLATADLSVSPDLRMPPDLLAPDMAVPPDMTAVVDMTVVDMTVVDMTVVDLTVEDLTTADLTTVDQASSDDLAGQDLSEPDQAAEPPPLVVSPSALTLFLGSTRVLAASEPVT